MRKVKLLTARYDGVTGQAQDIGDVIEVEPREAETLIQRGSALAVPETVTPPAKAANRKG